DGLRDALDPRLRSGALTRPSAKTVIERSDMPAAEVTNNLLDVQSLKTEFRVGDRIHHAVGGVSFSIKPGECLGIIGESGSGKSVTALSLLGLIASPPGVITGGSVSFRGEDTLGMKPEPLRKLRGGKVAYIFQDPLSTLHPLHRVGDQLVEAIRAHRSLSRQEAWQESVAMLERVRIPNAAARARSFPHELSGGMRQRVGIALALINQPDLVIADEPTTALDVTVQAEILALLDELRRERSLALIFITHDVGVVAQLCDRIAVMYAGRIVEMGPKDALLEAPRHPYTRRLIDCVPTLGAGRRRLVTIAGRPPSAADLPLGCAFAPRCPKAARACSNQAIELRKLGESTVRCLDPENAPV
ncbi:MAG: ABC transporter ATP-binding protein, partial [Geminicoccaceae bacterium]